MQPLTRTLAIATLALLTAAPIATQVPAAEETSKPAELTPEQLIQKGLDARRAGKNQEAIRCLQEAVAKIQAELAGDLASFLPAAMDGWTADAEKPQSGTWTAGGQTFEWSQAQRIYNRESDGARVTVTITSWPQMIEGQRAMLQMFKNPQMLKMMNADPNRTITPIEQASFAGWKTVEKGESAQAIALGKSLMVMVESDVDEAPVLDHHWSGIDFAKLAPIDAQAAKK